MSDNTFKYVDGVRHKLCTGPAHDEPTYLPATDKYFYSINGKRGSTSHPRIESRCRLCTLWGKVKSPGLNHGYVATRDVREMVMEAVNRVGMAEMMRRTGVSKQFFRNVIYLRTNSVQKAKVQLVLLELVSMRRKGEKGNLPSNGQWWVTRRSSSAVCSGCGTPQSNYTDGCSTCWLRKFRREERAA